MAGWSEQFEALSTQRYPALLAYATLLAGQRTVAEDLVHDALVTTFSRPRRLPTLGHAEAYVRRAILSRFLDAHRRRAALLRAFARVAEKPEQADASAGVDERDRVGAALAGLGPRERACVVLRYFEDLPLAEVADRLGIATGTAKRYLSDAAARLRETLDEIAPVGAEEQDDGGAIAVQPPVRGRDRRLP